MRAPSDYVRRAPESSTASLLEEVESAGWAIRRGLGYDEAERLARTLGSVLQVTDVRPRPQSPALVTSLRALDVHTDHHRAAKVAWICLRQAARGGCSLLVDAERVYRRLPPITRALLTQVKLMEHCVFDGDVQEWPLVCDRDGRLRFYYSFWLARRDLEFALAEALAQFREAVERAPRHEFQLQPGDLLVVDNHRTLHGRTAIEPNSDRWLRRFWLE